MAEFTAILLNKLPVTFDSLVFMGFSLKLFHDLDAKAVHSTVKMFDNMKVIKYNFGIRE